MERYEPPFAITHRTLQRVSSISEKLGRIEVRRMLEREPHLRRNNRALSVQASLSLEDNSLTLENVRDVLSGRLVIGPMREIQEVRNAFEAYGQMDVFDPWSLDDLKRLHGVMVRQTGREPGALRTGPDGFWRSGRHIHIMPPADMVPGLMRQLFGWMSDQRDEVHPLILSSVFHYEFMFIHPFIDGSGRMARLWQAAILSRWNALFQYIPIESRIERCRDDYFDALTRSTGEGSARPFVEFLLDRVDETLDQMLAQERAGSAQTEQVKRLLAAMEYDTPYTAAALMALLGLKSRDALRNNYLNPALESGLIKMTAPDKPTSRNQRYLKD